MEASSFIPYDFVCLIVLFVFIAFPVFDKQNTKRKNYMQCKKQSNKLGLIELLNKSNLSFMSFDKTKLWLSFFLFVCLFLSSIVRFNELHSSRKQHTKIVFFLRKIETQKIKYKKQNRKYLTCAWMSGKKVCSGYFLNKIFVLVICFGLPFVAKRPLFFWQLLSIDFVNLTSKEKNQKEKSLQKTMPFFLHFEANTPPKKEVGMFVRCFWKSCRLKLSMTHAFLFCRVFFLRDKTKYLTFEWILSVSNTVVHHMPKESKKVTINNK